MGDNEVQLFEGYLKLVEESKIAKQNGYFHELEVIKAKIEGIIFGYESYTALSFDSLIEKWEWYSRA